MDGRRHSDYPVRQRGGRERRKKERERERNEREREREGEEEEVRASDRLLDR